MKIYKGKDVNVNEGWVNVGSESSPTWARVTQTDPELVRLAGVPKQMVEFLGWSFGSTEKFPEDVDARTRELLGL